MVGYRHRSNAALLYECLMLAGDETIFLVPRYQGRRLVSNGHRLLCRDDRNQRVPPRHLDRNQRVPPHQLDREETIAEHIRARLVRDRTVVDEDGDFVVCLDNLVEFGNGEIARLDCGHQYHQCCIRNWLNVNNTCPLCKTTVVNGSSM
ncbi:RING-type E3 ubiquitin transferase [Salvia divinorum]|uniref:RING-type E3 ubiquitin transferase n=1 Tax=Salvia divinorum TaxID=28513 RepID=A0ABD1H9U8_SALDI